MKKILVPIDGSEHAFKALDFAADLAGKYGAGILLLYVVTRHEIPESLRRYAEVEHMEGPPEWIYAEVVAKNVLSDGEQRSREKGVADVQTVIYDGNPAEVIVDVARSKDIDVIVLGTRGLSDLQGIFMGSVAHKVCHLADQTVITVK